MTKTAISFHVHNSIRRLTLGFISLPGGVAGVGGHRKGDPEFPVCPPLLVRVPCLGPRLTPGLRVRPGHDTHDDFSDMSQPLYLALSPLDSDSADSSPRGSQCCWPLPRLTSVPWSADSWSRAPDTASAPRLFSFLRRLDT